LWLVTQDGFYLRGQLVESFLLLSNELGVLLSEGVKFKLDFLLSLIVLAVELLSLALEASLDLRLLSCLLLDLLSQGNDLFLELFGLSSD